MSLHSAVFSKNSTRAVFLWLTVGFITFAIGLVTYYFQNYYGLACGVSFRSGIAAGVFLWVYWLTVMFQTGKWEEYGGWPTKLIIGDEENIFY